MSTTTTPFEITKLNAFLADLPIEYRDCDDERSCSCGADWDAPHFVVDNEVCCDLCLREWIDMEQFEDLAREIVRLTSDDFEEYDPSLRHTPTREEYESGDRDGYSENAFVAQWRHRKTNYDVIVGVLDRYDPLDQMIYSAVRHRVHEVIAERLHAQGHSLADYVQPDETNCF